MSKHHYIVGDDVVLSVKTRGDADTEAARLNSARAHGTPALVVIDADTPSAARDSYWRDKNRRASRGLTLIAGV